MNFENENDKWLSERYDLDDCDTCDCCGRIAAELFSLKDEALCEYCVEDKWYEVSKKGVNEYE